MSDEPIYLAQTAEPMTKDQTRDWLKARAAEAKAEGCTFGRATYDKGAYLYEGWLTQPKDQGEPRWQMVAA